MAICKYCRQEMLKHVSCTFNSVQKNHICREAEKVASDNCGDCGAPRGGYHHPGCDCEHCPFCSGQMLGFTCSTCRRARRIKTTIKAPKMPRLKTGKIKPRRTLSPETLLPLLAAGLQLLKDPRIKKAHMSDNFENELVVETYGGRVLVIRSDGVADYAATEEDDG